MTKEPAADWHCGAALLLAQRATISRGRRMRRTGDQGRNACVARVAMDGHPGLARSRDSAAQWSPRAYAEQGLRRAMDAGPYWRKCSVHSVRYAPRIRANLASASHRLATMALSQTGS